jgi:hypothetical protein
MDNGLISIVDLVNYKIYLLPKNILVIFWRNFYHCLIIFLSPLIIFLVVVGLWWLKVVLVVPARQMHSWIHTITST